MNPAQRFVYTRTYSRWLPEQKRRETYPETVERLMEFFSGEISQIAPVHKNAARKAILSMDVMPSMRAMWAAGAAAKQNNITLYNCFAGDEKFVTYDGIRSFRETVGKSVLVKTSGGSWNRATIKSFGEQSLNEITLGHYNGKKPGNEKHKIRVTPNHRWLLAGGNETTSLKVGDVLFSPDLRGGWDTQGLIHGAVFGDGTLQEKKYAKIRLCGKKRNLLKYFEGYKVSYPPSYNGDPVVYLGNRPEWKQLPLDKVEPHYVAGFIRGLELTDGNRTSAGNIRISTQNKELASWLKRNAALAGYKVLSHRTYNGDTNYGKRSAPLHCILLGYGKTAVLRVESVKPAGVEEVFCAIEPTTHTFTLASGQITGNCAYTIINDVRVFAEILFILMCGTGIGFSVEEIYVSKLPEIRPATGKVVPVVIEDSKEGWADGLNQALQALWEGHNIKVDYSKVRSRGARLMTMGGRASGPEPLESLMNFASDMFRRKRGKTRGKKLQPIDCLDLANKIAEVVVVGGVRRSSQISLSDVADKQVSAAKRGEFWLIHPHRRMSNNSAVFDGKPDSETFLREWTNLVESKSGERGIYNAEGALRQATASGRRKPYEHFGVNPCAEIILRDAEFCNLSEVIVRAGDTLEDLQEKVKLATMMGMWQATFTHFPFLRHRWKKNCEEERLLGVSLTGIMDNAVLNNVNDKAKKWLAEMKYAALKEAEKWARKLDINMSAAITTVKPSGTVSQLVDSASGIHPRYNRHYIRRYRIAATDPLFRLLKDAGVPHDPELGEDPSIPSTYVLSFPVAAPVNCRTRQDYSALQQLDHWKMVKDFWCEHNASITVYVDADEWIRTGAWVYDNFDHICGVSFLPKDNGVYKLAPYEDITEAQYNQLLAAFPEIDYSKLTQYEDDDNTEGSKSYACTGDKCDL